MANTWVSRGNLKGDKGDPGDAGAAGRGITSAEINVSGHLIITYSDSTQVDLGDVTGEDGTSVNIQGSVPTADDLPTDLGPGDAGTGYLTDDDGHLHVWSGTAWIDAGEIRGPVGPTGLTGAPGVRGSTWTIQSGDPGSVPGDAIVGDAWLNTTTGEVFQIADV